MAMPAPTRRVRFGPFEADLRSGELRKQGVKVKLQDQPFQVLSLLLQQPGEMITREELRQKLWAADTFVDFDMGLNTAIKRLRDALGDKAESPRYVETLPRRGYRLIVPVEKVEAEDPEHQQDILPQPIGEPEKIVEGTDSSPPAIILKPHHRVSWRVATIGAVLLAALGAVSWWWMVRKSPTPPYAIAVLPFQNLGSEPDSDYFSDGLTDEIINNLSLIDGLQVKSRTSSFAFKSKPRNVHDVGSQLGASLILEGSVLRSGDKLRIDSQLIQVSDDSVLWSNRFDRKFKDVFAIQDEISLSIVNQLRLKLGRGQRRYNTDLEAYDLYLKAQTLTRDAPVRDRANLIAGIGLFEQVIAQDSRFAPAYAGLATAYGRLSLTPRYFSPDEAYAKMREASEKALELDPLLAEAYASRGLVYSRDLNWRDSEKAFRRSIELNGNLADSRTDFAISMLFPVGRLEEAVRELRKAVELDPLSVAPRDFLDYVLVSAGRYDEVLDSCRRIIAAHSDESLAEQLYARSLLQKGNLTEATAIFEKQEHAGTGGPGFLGYAYAKAGRRGEAEQIVAKYPNFPWVEALVYAGFDDKDRTLKALEKMAAIHDPRVGIYLTYPELALLHGDQRLSELRQKLGITPAP
jgi:TolB-like protein/DNA-binding winged helix-turn-helix (wHTH) protein/Tfp pilus assembly protein PilF